MTEQTKVDMEQLLAAIRKAFYAVDRSGKFFRDEPMLKKAITWPATWLRARGVTWSGPVYFKKLGELLREIKAHGATGEIHYFPGYLLKCFQDHFAHNGDTYCNDARTIRNAVDVVFSKVQFRDTPAPQETVIDVLAAAHALLATRQRPNNAKRSDPQLPLL